MNSVSATYQGRCFCGEVQFTVTGEPVAMGYCHCESCRAWSAGPINAFSLWKPEALHMLAKCWEKDGEAGQGPEGPRRAEAALPEIEIRKGVTHEAHRLSGPALNGSVRRRFG